MGNKEIDEKDKGKTLKIINHIALLYNSIRKFKKL
jgi:hypothetical protein